MKSLRIVMIAAIAVMLTYSFAFAAKHLPEERGKALFNDPKFAGGSKSCGACHPDGKGLENASMKKEFKIMGKTQKSLEEAVNFCIENANKGKAIDPKSDQMKDIVAYINTLKAPVKKAPGY